MLGIEPRKRGLANANAGLRYVVNDDVASESKVNWNSHILVCRSLLDGAIGYCRYRSSPAKKTV